MNPRMRSITSSAVVAAALTAFALAAGPSAASDPAPPGATPAAKQSGTAAKGTATTAKPSQKPAAKPGAGAKLKTVTLAIRHRVFHDFADQQAVTLNKDFLVGDTDYTARVVQYVPDFAMDLETHKVVSRSQEPRNPAFKIIVRQGKAYRDTTWAMLSLPPHFARNSYLAFKVMRVDFADREALVADSAQAYKELEALKQAALKMRPTEGDPHGEMQNPHGTTANPHAKQPTIQMVPSHGGTTKSSGDKDSK